MRLLLALALCVLMAYSSANDRDRDRVTQSTKPTKPKADANIRYGYIGNTTRTYSPITLSRDWPTLGRLILLISFSTFGTICNGFFVSAFFIEHALKRVGNVYLACAGLSDMLITTGAMPIAAVVMLSGVWDQYPVCKLIQFLGTASTYSYNLFYSCISLESYYRLCRTSFDYETFLGGVGLVSFLIFSASFGVAGVGVYMSMDYDYCLRVNYGSFYFRTGTFIGFYFIPALITFYCFFASSVKIRCRAREQVQYKRSHQYYRDISLNNINIAAYVMFIMGWTPYLIVVDHFPDATDANFYVIAWLGACRSMVASGLYCSLNRHFRRAFSQLFYYCCCKTNLNTTYHNRHHHRRAIEYRAGDVRVHIMHQAINVTSPQRGASACRETIEL